nr:IPT/TIG domain-containing protein [uncultured Solibaculum sp.]
MPLDWKTAAFPAAFDDSQLAPVVNTLDLDGTTATVTGYFFGEEQGSVQIGDQEAMVKSWSDNTITFTIPEDAAGLEEVQVIAKDGQYSRNFFEITTDVNGYKNLSTPNFSYGNIYGYEITSADVIPLTIAAAGGKILTLGMLVESNQLVMEVYDIESDTWSQAAARGHSIDGRFGLSPLLHGWRIDQNLLELFHDNRTTKIGDLRHCYWYMVLVGYHIRRNGSPGSVSKPVVGHWRRDTR